MKALRSLFDRAKLRQGSLSHEEQQPSRVQVAGERAGGTPTQSAPQSSSIPSSVGNQGKEFFTSDVLESSVAKEAGTPFPSGSNGGRSSAVLTPSQTLVQVEEPNIPKDASEGAGGSLSTSIETYGADESSRDCIRDTRNAAGIVGESAPIVAQPQDLSWMALASGSQSTPNGKISQCSLSQASQLLGGGRYPKKGDGMPWFDDEDEGRDASGAKPHEVHGGQNGKEVHSNSAQLETTLLQREIGVGDGAGDGANEAQTRTPAPNELSAHAHIIYQAEGGCASDAVCTETSAEHADRYSMAVVKPGTNAPGDSASTPVHRKPPRASLANSRDWGQEMQSRAHSESWKRASKKEATDVTNQQSPVRAVAQAPGESGGAHHGGHQDNTSQYTIGSDQNIEKRKTPTTAPNWSPSAEASSGMYRYSEDSRTPTAVRHVVELAYADALQEEARSPAGGLRRIIELLRHNELNRLAVENIAISISVISENDRVSSDAFGNHGAVEALLLCIVKYENNLEVTKRLVSALKNLVVGSRRNSELLEGLDGLGMLGRIACSTRFQADPTIAVDVLLTLASANIDGGKAKSSGGRTSGLRSQNREHSPSHVRVRRRNDGIVPERGFNASGGAIGSALCSVTMAMDLYDHSCRVAEAGLHAMRTLFAKAGRGNLPLPMFSDVMETVSTAFHLHGSESVEVCWYCLALLCDIHDARDNHLRGEVDLNCFFGCVRRVAAATETETRFSVEEAGANLVARAVLVANHIRGDVVEAGAIEASLEILRVFRHQPEVLEHVCGLVLGLLDATASRKLVEVKTEDFSNAVLSSILAVSK